MEKPEVISNTKKQNLFGGIFILVLFAGLNAGCSSTPVTGEKTLKSKDLTLSYLDKTRLGKQVARLKLKHPVQLDMDQVTHHLWFLRYEGNALMSKRSAVFNKGEILQIRRLLTRALNSVTSNNVVSFELDTKRGTTSGMVFATEKHLHWRFDEIQGNTYTLTGNQVTRYGTAWQMIPRKGQKLFVSQNLLGNKKWTNWIVARLKLPGQPPKTNTEKNRPQGTPQNFNPDTLEEKLGFLKRLYEKNLIDDQEYQQKRKDLLDQYLK